MNNFFKRTGLFLLIATTLVSCSSSGDDDSGGNNDNPAPSNLQLTADVVGTDAAHPNGDGSGVVNFTATADNATSFTFTWPDGTLSNSTDGTETKTFATGTYSVSVEAINSGGYATKTISFYVYNEPSLVWSDEFNTDGAPDTSKWSYEYGSSGWGNNELQNYTDSPTNVKVEGGSLKITARKEPSGSAAYSSARLKSENKFEFTYGTIEFRAKLPIGGGTWPAVWMLGENYATAAWPACGEIDMMEHVGNNQNTIYATLHYPNHSGADGNGNTTVVPTASTDFHIYKCEWTSASLKFYVDDVLFHTVANDPSVPFNHDFFFIVNFAMGGNFGGTIDPNFTESTLEIDYIRLYQ